MWLMTIVEMPDIYIELCEQMLDTKFVYFVGNDCNRAEDGLALRFEFEEEYGVIQDMDGECSLLEMFVKLAMRCEDDVMCEPSEGDRTSYWFWLMMENLGLTVFKGRSYDFEAVNDILDDFNNRHYGKNGGHGCAFKVRKPLRDMRTTEIWYQMMWWLNETFS